MDTSMRYAHCEGHTDLTYHPNGRFIITSGTDGDIRIFEGFEDDDPKTHHLGEVITSLALHDDRLYLATDANAVSVYTFPDIESDGIVLQFFTSVYHIACSNTGKYIAAGGGDFMIKIYDRDTKSFATCGIHEAPILSLAFDPDEKYLASSSCDGKIRIVQLPDYTCVKTFNLIKKSNDFCNSETICRLQWQPTDGKYLAIPVQKELMFYDRHTWELSFSLQDEKITEMLCVVAFSPCGTYVAAGANDGLIVVWDIKQKKCIGSRSHLTKLKICSLSWNPTGKKEILFCDFDGQMGMFDEFASTNQTHTRNGTEVVRNTDISMDNDDDLFADYNDEKSITDNAGNANKMAIDNDDDSAFDIGAMKAKWEPKIFGTDLEENDAVVTPAVSHERKATESTVPVTAIQIPFQPSSTPVHLDNRFMLWNTVGIVRCYNTEEENSIDVEFHDASIYHPVHVNNIHNFTMAALSVEALLLACSKTEETSSKLQCLHIGTWDSNKEWTIDMAEEEEIEAITLGTGWVAAATSNRLVRLFTISGIQCEIFCIPGPVVCLTASEDRLAVAFHRGPGLVGEQNLGVLHAKINLKCRTTCKEFSLPITAKAFLSWMGYTDEGQVCTVDTSGIVRLFNTSGYSKWMPIANTKANVKGKSDTYFVIGLSEIQQEIRCIPCKGSRYPSMLPRPTVIVLPFNLPFCDMSTDKGRLEEEQVRASLLNQRVKSLITQDFDLHFEQSSIEKKWTEVLLKMFALATRADREYRALDVAELMPSARAVQGAIKYATQRHHMALAERLGAVAHKKNMEEAIYQQNGVTSDDEEELFKSSGSSYNSSRSRNQREETEKLKPKPLKRNSSRQNDLSSNDNGTEVEARMEQAGDSFVSLLPRSSQTVNPFKVQLKKSANVPKEDSQNMDGALCESTRRLSSKEVLSTGTSEKKTSSKQSKLFEKKEKAVDKMEVASSPLVPKKFGFSLFLEESRERLQSENPDATESEMAKIAVKLFKELSAEEKEKYKSKPTQLPSGQSKRKIEDETKEDDRTDNKKSKTSSGRLSNGTNSFSMFAFVKKSS